MDFAEGRRYRLTIRPAGARTRTVERDVNYLGRDYSGVPQFDACSEVGTQTIPEDMIVEAKDIGPAEWRRG